MYLIDSNIIILSIKGNEDIITNLESIKLEAQISIVTRLEVMMGYQKDSMEKSVLESYLDEFNNIVLDSTIVDTAVTLNESLQKKIKFKDLVIAATAFTHNLTIITCDNDFKTIPQLKVKLINL
jgi:predicted nucleic acid-binding protein